MEVWNVSCLLRLGASLRSNSTPILETWIIKFYCGETHKLQFVVTRLQFHIARISNFSKATHHLVPPCCFSSKCITFITQKRGNSFIWVEKSNKRITDRYRKLLSAFKHGAVQFLVPKNLARSHLPLDTLPAIQTWTPNMTLRLWSNDILRFAVCGFPWKTWC